tara:strand:- start:6719 stop:7324 length:606 start_codon:yes stop_codon:yes gene_type:complete
MALSYPYSVDFLAKCLSGPRIPLALQRFEEMSGSGDGRFWATQLARPLWGATYELYSHSAEKARELNAKIYGLDGSSKTFLWADPYYTGAVNGPAPSGITVSAISSDRNRISFSGDFDFTAGDFISITHSSGRYYFGTLVENGTTALEIRPALHLGISVGDTVEVNAPRFKAIIPPGGFTPFASFRGRWGDSASITILQKI